ncbi:MAG TPA: hypothetical protein PKI11_02370 [Candidatus Hydrogenedentes bacterium]|nr:hypothetical protein [Candidatus Hydrogenedentota bacterium]
MAILLGEYVFDDARTAAAEKYEEIGGRDARKVRIAGAITGKSTLADLEAALDDVLAAASTDAANTPLVLRDGRRLLVRRTGFTREVGRKPLVGSFVIDLEAPLPFEEAVEETEVLWGIIASGASQPLVMAGNAPAPVRIDLVAVGAVIAPRFSDGVRAISYSGVVSDGETLLFDGPAGRVLLEGEDVTPYTEGVFPRVSPGGTLITYTDAPGSTHTADVAVSYRDRWW